MDELNNYQKIWKDSYLKLIGEDENNPKYDVSTIDDTTKISEILPKVVPMIESSYKDGFKGTLDIRRLRNTIPLVKVVYGNNGDILACSLYRKIEKSLKAICGGQNKTEEGKEALKEIIKSDIEPYTNWVWEEVSGPIEHYFKKFNGYLLPNIYAPIVLDKPKDKIELMEDGFHYKRVIGIPSEDNKPEKKVIYGFRSKEIADEVLSKSNYEIMRTYFNSENMDESMYNNDPRDLHRASSFVNQLSDLYDEEGFRELTPWMHSELSSSIETFEKYITYDEWVSDALKNAEFLRDNMPLIKPI